MRVDPLNILLDKNFKPNKSFYFISGNEITLMEKVCSFIIEKFNENTKSTISKIDTIDNFVIDVGLFEEKRVYVAKNCKGINEENLKKILNKDTIFVFFQENSSKTKSIKTIFNKNENACLIDCYELNKEAKSKILNNFIKDNSIAVPREIYWELLDKLDNRYGLLENTLNNFINLQKNDIKIENINKILSINENGKDKIFFNLLKSNKDLVSVYREKILSGSDVNELYYYCKFHCQLIIDNKDIETYTKKIPIYLFKEKPILIDIFKKYNQKKKKLLLHLLFRMEESLRKNSGLSLISGLRFVLSIKKITVS